MAYKRVSFTGVIFVMAAICSIEFTDAITRLNSGDIPCDVELEMSGQLKYYPYEIFENIVHCNKSAIVSLVLHKFELVPTNFVKELGMLTNLEKIYLLRVSWNGEFKGKWKKTNLVRVHIERSVWSFSDTTPNNLLDQFFFPAVENMKATAGFSMYFEDHVGGKLSFYRNELSIYRIPYDTQQLFPYTRLDADLTVIDISKFHGSDVKELKIQGSLMTNGTPDEFLKKLVNVSTLKLMRAFFKNGSTTYDLSQLNLNSLESLIIDNSELIYFSQANGSVEFEKLNYLYLENAVVNFSGVEFRSNTLRNVELCVQFVGGGYDFLRKLNGLGEIRLIGYEKNSTKPMDVLDLSLLPSYVSLATLSLTNFKIILTRLFQFDEVKQLHLSRCVLDQSLVSNFSFVFDYTDEISLFRQDGDVILDEILKSSISTIQVITDKEEVLGLRNVKLFNLFNISVHMDGMEISFERGAYGEWHISVSASPPGASLSTEEFPEVHIDKGVKWYNIYVFTMLGISIIGTLGNIISVAVLSRKEMMSSTSCLMIALALLDLTILVTFAAFLPLFGFKLVTLFPEIYTLELGQIETYPLIQSFGDNVILTLMQLEAVQSRFIYPLWKSIYTASVYITVALTLERFAAVMYPLKIRTWTSKKKAVRLCVTFVLIAFVVNFPRWFENTGSRIRHIGTFLIRDYTHPSILQNVEYRKFYHGVFWTAFMYSIPIPILCFFNAAILYKVCSSSKRRRDMSQTKTKDDNTALTIMLLSVSVCFVVCNLANGVITWYFVSSGSYDPRDIDVFSCIPIMFNSSTNFFFYCLMGKRFRAELLKLFCKFTCFRKLFGRMEISEQSRHHTVGSSRPQSSLTESRL